MSNSPAELGTQQSSFFPVAIAILWGPDDLPRSDAFATFLNCTALSPETNISVINHEVSKAGLTVPISAEFPIQQNWVRSEQRDWTLSLAGCNQADEALGGLHLTVHTCVCTAAEASTVSPFS